MSARCKHQKYSLHIESVMELYYLVYLFVLNDFTVEALLRVERAANCPQITNFVGRVKYRRKGTRVNFRCPKKFDRYGPKFATCQDDGTWSNEPPFCTKAGCLPLDQNLVSNLDMDVVNQAVVKFSCEQNYHLIGETLAYCDGKDWSAPLPRCAAPRELTECDFEEDLCGWTQDDSDEQDWIRNLGPTPTGNTGPKYDHTYGDTGNGHYLFFETSNPTMTGHQAILYSPVYDKHLSPMCFDFWYHILGPDEAGHVGSLEVFVLDQSQFIDDDDIQPLFVKEGNHGDKWQRGDIFIDSQVESYQVVIVATRALSYISDIAIDDVRLYNCSRQNKTGQTTIMTQTSSTPTPPTKESTTTTMTQTTQTNQSTTIISSTKTSTETSTQSPTTITYKRTNTTLKTTTAIIATAQSMSTSQVSVSTKALPSTAKSSTSSLSTKISTQTPQKTKPDTTATPITTPSQEQSTLTMSTAEATGKSSAKTTLKSTSTTTQKTKLPSSTTKSTASSTLSLSTTSSKSTTKPRPSTSTTPASTTTSVKTFSPSSEEKTPSTLRASTSQTESPRKISSTTTKPMLKSTRISSSKMPSSTSITTKNDLSTTSQSSTVNMNDITGKENAITKNQNTYAENTKTSTTTLHTTKVSKPSKRTNALTTKSSVASNTTKDNSISVTNERSQHPEDETLKPLLIGLCVGIVAGLIIIGVIAYVCVRRRKFYTSRYEDELKPITNSASVQSLNNGHYYQDEEYESES